MLYYSVLNFHLFFFTDLEMIFHKKILSIISEKMCIRQYRPSNVRKEDWKKSTNIVIVVFWDAGWSCMSSLVAWVFRNLCNGIHLKFCSFSLLTSLMSSFQYTTAHYIQYFLEGTTGICELHIILPSHLFFSLENIKAKVESTKAPFGFSSICVKTGFWNPILLMVIATWIFWSSLNFKTHAPFFFFFFCCMFNVFQLLI